MYASIYDYLIFHPYALEDKHKKEKWEIKFNLLFLPRNGTNYFATHF